MRTSALAVAVIGVGILVCGALGAADLEKIYKDCDTCGPDWITNTVPPYKGYARGWAMISADELKELWDAQVAWNNRDTIGNGEAPKENPKLVIVDVGKPALHYRAEGHIPGAFNTWREDYDSGVKVWDDVPAENILSREDFQAYLRRFGIDNDSQVVFYDHKYDATRLWWACKLYGFNVRVLDGGFNAWKDAGYEVDRLSSPSQPAPGNVVLKGGEPLINVSHGSVYKCKDDPMWMLWDIRSTEEITGERNRAKRMGAIPWSKALVPWKEVHGEDGTFLDANQLKTMVIDKHGFDEAAHHVFFCQSGVRVTQTMFALYLYGYPLEHLHIYDDAWIWWGNNPDTPIIDENGEPVTL